MLLFGFASGETHSRLDAAYYTTLGFSAQGGFEKNISLLTGRGAPRESPGIEWQVRGRDEKKATGIQPAALLQSALFLVYFP